MKILLVACETIEDEIKTALLSLEIDYEVLWLEGGLHFNPNHLRDRLQQVFDEAQGRYDRLLVSLGYCGGGVSGLTTYDYETVLPLADDCLSLLLGSMQARQLASKPPTYFLTSGWMRHENNVVTSYQKCIEKYGLRRSERIHRIMLHNYHRFGLVETGCYDMKNAVQQVQDLAQAMDLKVETLPGDLEWVKRFLLGPYDDPERFLVIPPNSKIDFTTWLNLMTNFEATTDTSQLSAMFPISGPPTSKTTTSESAISETSISKNATSKTTISKTTISSQAGSLMTSADVEAGQPSAEN